MVALDGDEARIWGRTWSQRILYSSVAEQALEYAYATQADLDRLSVAWATWAGSKSPFYMFAQMAVLAVR